MVCDICGRKIKVHARTKSQTVNVCSSANILGQYDYIVRLRPPFISPATLLSQNFNSIEDLVRYLERHHSGETERRPVTRAASATQLRGADHPLLDGIEAICSEYRRLDDRVGLFNRIYEGIRTNWIRYREPDRWPTTDKNWVLRVAREYTYDPIRRHEKQLQKEIAIGLENEGWGNDVPTASGLVNSRGRGINVDLGHRITDGFELIELKTESNTPYDAALQILRYGAIYMLYRLEPELARRFKSNEMLRAKRIVLEVLAPCPYYSCPDVDLQSLETQLDREVASFASGRTAEVSLSFRFMALPPEFLYRPGADAELIREAVHRRASPFLGGCEPQGSFLVDEERMRTVDIKGHAGQPIRSFADWEQHSLPPERKVLHWKEGRSAFELGRSWTSGGEPTVPAELVQLLESHEGTKRTVIKSGITEHETTLPG